MTDIPTDDPNPSRTPPGEPTEAELQRIAAAVQAATMLLREQHQVDLRDLEDLRGQCLTLESRLATTGDECTRLGDQVRVQRVQIERLELELERSEHSLHVAQTACKTSFDRGSDLMAILVADLAERYQRSGISGLTTHVLGGLLRAEEPCKGRR